MEIPILTEAQAKQYALAMIGNAMYKVANQKVRVVSDREALANEVAELKIDAALRPAIDLERTWV